MKLTVSFGPSAASSGHDAVQDIYVLIDYALFTETDIFAPTSTSFTAAGIMNGQIVSFVVTGRGLTYNDNGLSGGTIVTIEFYDGSSLGTSDVILTIEGKIDAAALFAAVEQDATNVNEAAVEEFLSSFDYHITSTDAVDNLPQNTLSPDGQPFNLNGHDTIFLAGGNDFFSAGAGNDYVNGGTGSDTLRGGEGKDTLVGGANPDRLFGGDDDDLIQGGGNSGGKDTLVGDGGDDTLLGQLGFDLLNGGDGNDSLNGGPQADVLFGRDGEDTLVGGDGLDRLFGGNGDDTGFGGDGNDGMFGQRGDDLLFGQGGNDRFFGGQGNDKMFGGEGNDTMFAGAGFDTLNGGVGDDLLKGNFNADVFVFQNGHGDDTISDFDANNVFEKIDLRGISAITDLQDLKDNHVTQNIGSLVIDTGGGNSITLVGVDLDDLDNSDFLFSM